MLTIRQRPINKSELMDKGVHDINGLAKNGCVNFIQPTPMIWSPLDSVWARPWCCCGLQGSWLFDLDLMVQIIMIRDINPEYEDQRVCMLGWPKEYYGWACTESSTRAIHVVWKTLEMGRGLNRVLKKLRLW